MDGKIPEHIIQDIKDRVSIREVVEDYVRLQKDGANHKGLCPFHQEKTPSFKVHEGKGIYKCFGCGESGNIFNFLMKMESMSFREAAERLAQRAGVTIPREEPKPGEREAAELKERIFAANLAAARFYRDCLQEGGVGLAAREYLNSRAMKPETIKRFGLGFSPPGWQDTMDALTGQGIAAAEIHAAGLIIQKDAGGFYDRFRGRLMFPIMDVQGRVRGFGARLIAEEPDQPKYLNSPETPVFKKGSGFYGLYQAKDAIRKAGRVVVVEGYFDQIALSQAGIGYAVAALGTAFTQDHAYALKRYGAEVFMVFDADEAGRKAAFRALEVFLDGGLSPRMVAVPDGKDPDEYLKKHGPAEFETLLERSPTLLEAYMKSELDKAGPTPADKSKAITASADMIGRVRDPIERRIYLDKLSGLTGVPASEFAPRLRRPEMRGEGDQGEAVNGVSSLSRAEEDFIRVIVHHPELMDKAFHLDVASGLENADVRNFLEEMHKQYRNEGKSDPVTILHKFSDGGLSNWITRVILEVDPNEGSAEKALDDIINRLKRDAIDKKIRANNRKIEDAKSDATKYMALLAEQQKLIDQKRRIVAAVSIPEGSSETKF